MAGVRSVGRTVRPFIVNKLGKPAAYVSLAASFALATGPAFFVSNEEFAEQVGVHKAKMLADSSYEKKIRKMCQSLNTVRKQEDPRCVADRNVQRDTLRRRLKPITVAD